MSIRVRGTITIQRKTSARGAFNIGDLSTEIGEFEVKDSLIEEFEPGKYTGDFIIRWIAPDSFAWRGRVFVKNRATLDEIIVDEADEGAPAPSAPPEPDPIEHAPAPSQAKATQQQETPAPSVAPVTDARKPAGQVDDVGLFGEELVALLQECAPIKLDPTVDREQFRKQRDRLKEIGYSFDAKAQTWSIKDLVSA
jgi:hypothetical protein